jgi:hypothetical protein
MEDRQKKYSSEIGMVWRWVTGLVVKDDCLSMTFFHENNESFSTNPDVRWHRCG